ncbi:hypothetical protein DM01DRAFT_1179172 [Hesseltinella vesiculosa]|nr:hypothetical protein DM01DRAFT_1179172 [Hesseltinella vesiculosa]
MELTRASKHSTTAIERKILHQHMSMDAHNGNDRKSIADAALILPKVQMDLVKRCRCCLVWGPSKPTYKGKQMGFDGALQDKLMLQEKHHLAWPIERISICVKVLDSDE